MKTRHTNWAPLVRISDFCETGSGGTPSRTKATAYFGGTIPWVKSGELRENTITETEEKITALGLKESAAKLLPRDTLLVALYGATVGRIGVLGIEAATNQAVCHIIPDQQRANRQYLFYALQAQVPDWLSKRVGGGQPNISQGIIRETLIPLPSLDEQKRIAYLLSKVEGLIAQRKQHLQQLDDLLKSVFLDMFGDPLRNEKGWDVATLDDFCERIVDCPHSTPVYSDGPTGNYCVRSSDIVSGFLDLKKTFQVDEAIFAERIKRHQPQIGDIVYSREGGRLGNAARIIDAEKVCLGQRMMLFKTNTENHCEFLWALLESVPFKAKLQGLVGGGAAPRVNIKDLTKISVIKPAQALQSRFAEVVKKMDRTRSVYRLSLTELEFLFGVLSQRAFRGELDLSRVVLPESSENVNVDVETTQQTQDITDDAAYELPSPADLKKLGNTKGREVVVNQWLEAYSQQLGKQPFSNEAFIRLAQQKLSKLQSADDAPDYDYEFAAADYDHVKDWIFQNLESQRVKQDYDDANNRVQIFAAKD